MVTSGWYASYWNAFLLYLISRLDYSHETRNLQNKFLPTFRVKLRIQKEMEFSEEDIPVRQFMDDPDIQWRTGSRPDYTKV